MGARTEQPAARILLPDAARRVLCFGFDPGDGRPPFRARPGDCLDPGEDFATGARHELPDETGPDLDCGLRVGRMRP